MITKERILEVLHTYIENDLALGDPAYVRDVLTDVCGCMPEEIRDLGLDWLWPDGEV